MLLMRPTAGGLFRPMKESAKALQFEKAAQFRDEVFELRRLLALEDKIIGPGDLMAEDVSAVGN